MQGILLFSSFIHSSQSKRILRSYLLLLLVAVVRKHIHYRLPPRLVAVALASHHRFREQHLRASQRAPPSAIRGIPSHLICHKVYRLCCHRILTMLMIMMMISAACCCVRQEEHFSALDGWKIDHVTREEKFVDSFHDFVFFSLKSSTENDDNDQAPRFLRLLILAW